MKSVRKNLLAGFLLLSSLAQVPHAHADVIYDLPNLEEGELPPVPESQAPSAPAIPNTPPAPAAPNKAPAAPSASAAAALQAHLDGWTAFDKISSRDGGDLFIVELKNAMPLQRLEISIAGRARILTSTLITAQGRRIVVREFTRTRVLESGSTHLSENLNLYDPVKKIEIRLQSYGSEAMAKLTALSNAGKPVLKFTRAPVETRDPKEVSIDRSGRYYAGLSVIRENKYSGVITRVYYNDMVTVRDDVDGKEYTRELRLIAIPAYQSKCLPDGTYCVGTRVVTDKKYLGKIVKVSGTRVTVRNEDGTQYSREAGPTLLYEVSCENLYCPGKRVKIGNNYGAVIVAVLSNYKYLIREDDTGHLNVVDQYSSIQPRY